MTKRFLPILACAALVIGLTTACQTSAPDIGAEQAKAFQSRVLTVSSSVAGGSYAAALEELTALETELDAAAADGSVSFARHQRIEAALTVVRVDIQTAIDALAPAAPAETVAPVAPDEEDAPDEETKAEEKAREAAEKAQKEAEEAAKKAAEEQKKAEEKAKKDAENGGEGDD